ncbi:hypothetical protein EVAR_9791_1 [Eumeta japonica]|uniref:Uncharacterized protein n=1 Tax=Eumeta variegata TaxID=151549 RepID=A0A4C1U6Z9_EUMVA|nr:hypothetical protein EVAR_9791_1 [Eumeta japonica]
MSHEVVGAHLSVVLTLLAPGGCDCLHFPEDVPSWHETGFAMLDCESRCRRGRPLIFQSNPCRMCARAALLAAQIILTYICITYYESSLSKSRASNAKSFTLNWCGSFISSRVKKHSVGLLKSNPPLCGSKATPLSAEPSAAVRVDVMASIYSKIIITTLMIRCRIKGGAAAINGINYGVEEPISGRLNKTSARKYLTLPHRPTFLISNLKFTSQSVSVGSGNAERNESASSPLPAERVRGRAGSALA